MSKCRWSFSHRPLLVLLDCFVMTYRWVLLLRWIHKWCVKVSIQVDVSVDSGAKSVRTLDVNFMMVICVILTWTWSVLDHVDTFGLGHEWCLWRLLINLNSGFNFRVW